MLCAAVAISLQVGTNYANDYADGVRGTDEARVGPFRLTASRLGRGASVRAAAWAASRWPASPASCSRRAPRGGWWPIGVTAVLAGWFYTGGPRPYGYSAMASCSSVVYFGLVATVGTAYVQHRDIPDSAWWFGVATGSMACALLEANNLRDVEGDQVAGKRTLAARLGRQRASWLYAACVAGAAVGVALGGEIVFGASPCWCSCRRCDWPSHHERARLAALAQGDVLDPTPRGGALVVTFFTTR